MNDPSILALLERIATALERQAPPHHVTLNLSIADAFLWNATNFTLQAIPSMQAVPIKLLRGIDTVRDILFENTRRFANGLPANNALLWGARGMGKSSLIKAIHVALNLSQPSNLALIEIHRDDIASLPVLMRALRGQSRRIILFCDDLSFDAEDGHYKSLKAALDGGVEGRPENVLFYATSNRRHLLPREMIENERSSALHPAETVEEKVSLSDRFGLWLGFHSCSQEEFFAMIQGYIDAYALGISESEWKPRAIEWAATRGARSGRVAWQFIQELAGSLGRKLA